MAKSIKLLVGLLASLQLMGTQVYAEQSDSNIDDQVYTEHNYVVNVHFSNVAYGQAVEKVVAHLGVAVIAAEPGSEELREYWQDTKNIDLEYSSTGFVGSLLCATDNLRVLTSSCVVQ